MSMSLIQEQIIKLYKKGKTQAEIYAFTFANTHLINRKINEYEATNK